MSEYVRVGLKLKDGGELILTLFIVPTICAPLTSHSVPDCHEVYPHLRGLELAEDSSQLRVDILVGSDHYWDLISGQVK